MEIEYADLEECPQCGAKKIIADRKRGEVACSECGLIIADKLKDLGPEWRHLKEGDKDERRGGPPIDELRFDKGLTTHIQKRSRDGKGRELNGDQRRKSWKLRMTERRTKMKNSQERGIAFASTEIQKISSTLNLPRRLEVRSLNLYRKAAEEGLIRGRSREGVATASVYAACRMLEVPRTMEEIARVSAVDRKEMRRSFLSLSRNLNLDVPPAEPADYINRFGGELELSTESRMLARNILMRAQDKGLVTGRNPRGIVGAILYLAGKQNGEKRTQKRTADTVSVTEVTLRNRFRELEEELDLGD